MAREQRFCRADEFARSEADTTRRHLAVGPMPSGTRREELILSPQEYQAVTKLRRALAALDPQ